MSEKPTATDAQLILQLYDLRRESEMRKARKWWLAEFWPQNADDFIQVASAMGTEQNAWLRQVSSYWGMVASLVLHGTINADLFLEPSVSGEMYFLFGKVHPFLKEVREKSGNAEMFASIEKLINSSQYGRDRLEFTLKRIQMLQERRKSAAKA